MRTDPRPHRPALPLLLLLAATGCSAGTTTALGPDTTVVVTVSPPTADVPAGGTRQFTAEVTGAANAAVTWEIQEGATGGAVSAAGLYTAPGAAGTAHVVARSQAAPASIGSATVTILPPPVTVTVTPPAPTCDACGTVTFHAAVGGATSQAVTWSVQEGAAGGTISAAGVYQAPAAAGTYHVVATSPADVTRPGSVPVVVGAERVLKVEVSPPTFTLSPGATTRYTATITTTCGSSAATALVAGPPAVTSP